MESQPQNPELRNNPENFHPCFNSHISFTLCITEFSKKKCLSWQADSCILSVLMFFTFCQHYTIIDLC